MKSLLFLDYLRYFYPVLFFWKISNLIVYKSKEKRSVWTPLYRFCQMKSQELVLSKYDNGEDFSPSQWSHQSFIDWVVLQKNLWSRDDRFSQSAWMFNNNSKKSIDWKHSKTIKSTWGTVLSKISSSIGNSIRRILNNDRQLQAYNMQKEALLTDQHKEWSLQIGYEQIYKKKTPWLFCFQPILTESITDITTEYDR